MMTTLREFGPNVEAYSIDEVFMGLHGMQVDWLGCGHKICNTLWRNIRMPVGVGIDPSKTLEKLANRGAKPPPPSAMASVRWIPHRQHVVAVRLVREIITDLHRTGCSFMKASIGLIEISPRVLR
ncbi:hypothetical protein ACJJIX_00120 [Microbulbifer sp. VAAC004]|uniref:Y-family DNA polymerase n=1 Tax=unclassified Microbulbifer TaxID=2619833 RepID=UPI0040392DC2